MTRHLTARLVALALVTFAASSTLTLGVVASPARAGTLTMTSCAGYGDAGIDTQVQGPGYGPAVWAGTGAGAFSTSNRCGQGGSFQIIASGGQPRYGAKAGWYTVAPPAIEIVGAWTPAAEVLMDPLNGDGWSASFFWAGGTLPVSLIRNCCGGLWYATGINGAISPSRYFGWQVTCVIGACGQPGQVLDVKGIQLVGVDTTRPGVVALGSGNIWYQSGRWIRGSGWSASFQASADDGVCAMEAIVDGQTIAGPYDPPSDRNTHSWTQCWGSQTQNLTIDTTQYFPNTWGALPLTLVASDAASPANVSTPSEMLQVDNTPVTLSLTGPSDAVSTAGTEYVSASATAGGSGVASIDCSTDGSPYQAYPGASARIPVSGLGSHRVVCVATNNAVDYQGVPASSRPGAFTMTIRQPSEATISFTRIVDKLHCGKVRVHEKIPAHWVTVHRHGRPVQVKRRARTLVLWQMRCRPHSATSKFCHAGHCRTQHVITPPHIVLQSTWRARFGKGAVVSGWLVTPGGVAIADQPVQILTAPENGSNTFTVATTATTTANGTWTARLPPGPSRLVEATYGGSSTIEPAASSLIQLLVPARIKISITPHVIPWSGWIVIRGHLAGGYVPPDGVAMRLLIGLPHRRHPYSPVPFRTNARGSFKIHWSFGTGAGVGTFPVWIGTTSTESDYPFSASISRKVKVTFGLSTPAACRRSSKLCM